VQGVELLRRSTPRPASAAERRPPSPRLAALCALVPGLGAVYNRQNVKALLHFLLIIGLFDLADLTDLAIFGVGGAVFYFFSILDAYRTAEAVAQGLDPVREDERVRQMLRERIGWVAAGLIFIGGVILISDLTEAMRVSLAVRRLWPLLFVAVGVYLLYRRARSAPRDAQRFDPRRAPPPLFWKTESVTGPLAEVKPGDEPRPPAKGPRT